MFDEAVGSWTESLTGNKTLNKDMNTWGPIFMRRMWPYKRDQLLYRNTGYGMSLFLKYLAKKTSANSIVEIYQDFRDNRPTLYKALVNFFTKNKLGDFETLYDGFVADIVRGKDYDGFSFFNLNYGQSIKTEEPVTINGEKETGSQQVYNYGILCGFVKYDPKLLEKNATCTVEKSDCRLNISPHSALLL